MRWPPALQITALLTALSSAALAENAAPKAAAAAQADAAHAHTAAALRRGTALPSLPLFELPTRASDLARQHVGLAHALRDSRRAEPTSEAATSAVGLKAPQARDTAQFRRACAQERRDAAGERREAAAQHREAATDRRLNAEKLRSAAEERRANPGRQ